MISTSQTEQIIVTAKSVEESIEHSSDLTSLAILNYWQRIKGTALAPCWSDWDWLEIPPTAIQHCGVVDVIGAKDDLDLVYRFWGTAHAKAIKQEMTGKSVITMRPHAEASQVFAQYRVCCERREPCLFTTTIQESTLGISIEELSLRLPFVGDDGESISQIFAYSYIRGDKESIQKVLVASIDIHDNSGD